MDACNHAKMRVRGTPSKHRRPRGIRNLSVCHVVLQDATCFQFPRFSDQCCSLTERVIPVGVDGKKITTIRLVRAFYPPLRYPAN
ncbi:hypothetical protein GHT06_008679 [Daphnia sinensis]|uniref:Uncharacterized protein n=1 Tax=Daphnia sinensis TaxID=1820382 RepID=A0AAD5LMF8_9CRUS|nr:hypothetical protein GHT06_008679 [Daphnia sinensis]